MMKIRFVGFICVNSFLLLLTLMHTQAQTTNTSNRHQEITLSLQNRDSSGSLSARHVKIDAGRTAIVVVDMWDQHWCKSFSQKTAGLIPKMNYTLKAARSLGMQVVFAPSDVTGFYKDSSQRKAALQYGTVQVKAVKTFDPPRPPYSQTGGCECSKDRPCVSRGAWSRQHKDLIIEPEDLISESDREMVSIFKKKNIDRIIYMGVASNMCVTVTRPFAAINMTRYGFNCVIVRDLVEAISGNGYNPDTQKVDPQFTPQDGSRQVIEHIEKYIAPTIIANQLVIQAGMKPLVVDSTARSAFDQAMVSAYEPKGPTVSFRQLCYDFNWVGRTLNDIPKKFTLSDPVEMAELSRKANVDAALILAVPHPGYTTYNSRYGDRFPGLKTDWFGDVVTELHKRNIHAFGYITLGVHWKFMRENVGMPYIHSAPDEDGTISHEGLCINAPGYLELLENYSRELLTNYPLDAMRYDMLYSAKRCECDGCHKLFKSLYGVELTNWKDLEAKDSTIFEYFYLATLRNAGERLTKVCRAVKPQVEIWQNHINTYSQADVNSGRQYDVAYIEDGHPIKLLALRGILDKEAIIIGQTLTSPIRRLIMALGGRCYQYIQVNQETALPEDRSWVLDDLSPFFKMVSQAQPFLEHATLPSTVGLLYSENTRYHFPEFNRRPYMESCESITGQYLSSSLPIKYINALDLHKKNLSAYKVLLLPRTTGLSNEQLNDIKNYVNNGGTLIASGDALLYDEKGRLSHNFSLANEMGIRLKSIGSIDDTIKTMAFKLLFDVNKKQRKAFIQTTGDSLSLTNYVSVESVAGKTTVWLPGKGTKSPLVHENAYGKGRFVYVAEPDNAKLTRAVADYYSGMIPIQISVPAKQVVFAQQQQQNRYVLHLIDRGDYQVKVKKDFATFRKVTTQYPQTGWSAAVTENKTDWIITVKGDAEDRLLVLE